MCKDSVFRLKCNRISGILLTIMKDFLAYWYERLDLNGETFKWIPVNAGVFQGSILRCYNNSSAGIWSNARLRKQTFFCHLCTTVVMSLLVNADEKILLGRFRSFFWELCDPFLAICVFKLFCFKWNPWYYDIFPCLLWIF